MDTREQLRRSLASRQDEVLELCRSLVRIPSEDPPGDIRPVCDFLRGYLADHGVTAVVHALDPLKPNVVARVAFGGGGPNVVFNGHMETLPVGDRSRWTHDPFGAAVVDGRVFGRGTRCMKGGITALVTAALAVREVGDGLRGAITLAFVSDEVNGGGLGTKYLVDTVPDVAGDVALVGEGGPWINFAHKGVVFAEFGAEGDAGHGAYGFNRSSATHRMIALLQDLRGLEGLAAAGPPEVQDLLDASRAFTERHYGAGAHEALQRVSVNVGQIAGGVKTNVIAEECRASVDFRLPCGMTTRDLLAKIEALVAQHPGTTFRIVWMNDPTASSPGHPWFQLLQRNSQEILGEPLPFGCTHGFTDARFFRLRGIPAAAVGLVGENVGAPDEFIALTRLFQNTQLFALTAYDYLAGTV